MADATDSVGLPERMLRAVEALASRRASYRALAPLEGPDRQLFINPLRITTNPLVEKWRSPRSIMRIFIARLFGPERAFRPGRPAPRGHVRKRDRPPEVGLQPSIPDDLPPPPAADPA